MRRNPWRYVRVYAPSSSIETTDIRVVLAELGLQFKYRKSLIRCLFCNHLIYPRAAYKTKRGGAPVFGRYTYTTDYFCSKSCAEEHEEIN